MNKGLLIVISGPSGVGKGTVLSTVFERDDNLVYSVSCTTRNPRPGEIDGVHYHFISKEEFESNIENGKMLEYALYCDNYYGTNAEYVERERNKGKDVVLEIETQGAMKVKNKCGDAAFVFIAPPSLKDLELRLLNRGTEDSEIIARRVERARQELDNMSEYEYIIVNDKLDQAIDELSSIIKTLRIKNNKNKIIQEVCLK